MNGFESLLHTLVPLAHVNAREQRAVPGGSETADGIANGLSARRAPYLFELRL